MFISGSALGYISTSATVSVLDHETLSLSLSKSTVSEFGGQATGTITRNNTDISQPLTVAITSSDTSEATVPASVIIPANATSVTFAITAVDDNLLDGSQTVVIAPTASGYFNQSASIEVTDFEPIGLTIAPIAISERNQTAVATLTRTDATQAMTINLTSSDSTEATVPASIVLSAGQASANFIVSAVDDNLLDGSQSVMISASANGYETGSHSLTVTDYEELQVTFQQSLMSEFGGSTIATVRRGNSDIAGPLTVTVLSSDLSEASVPTSVTIPAGQSSATFLVEAVDDTLLDGPQFIRVTTTAAGYVGGSSDIRVDDYETITVALSQSSISENGGTASATVTRSNTDNASLISVSITNSDLSEVSVPATIIIPAGQSSATFVVTAQDDALLDGTQSVAITISATGYVGESRSLSVTDHETLTVSIDRAIINEQGGLATGTVRRSNSDTAQALLVNLIKNRPGEASLPATVTIPANQSSVTFPISAIDDGVDDGAQTVTITAVAGGYSSLPGSVIVADGIALALSFAVNTISELGGMTVGTVTRANTDLSADLVVTLSSSDTSELIVPSSLVIPAGQLSRTFNVLAVDDSLLDGSQLTTVTAVAPSIAPTQSSITITDHELLSLQIDRSSMSEAGGQASGIVTRGNTDIGQALTLNLSSSDITEATVPTSVTIPAGQSSVGFIITAVDDTLLDGEQKATLSTSASGYIGTQMDIEIVDAEELVLAIQSSSISEEAGSTIGTITRSNSDIAAALLVTLLSSDPSEATVPATVIIPGGQSSVSFNIAAVDDTLLDGTQLVVISGSAVGYTNANASMSVLDAESLVLSFNESSIAENGGQIAASLSRSNSDWSLPLTALLSSSDTSEVLVPTSVTIPAGKASVNFIVDAVDDALLDGIQLVEVTASASGYSPASQTLAITDYETLSIHFDSSSVSELQGRTMLTIGRRNSDISAPQIVTLTNGDNSELSIPSTVTIPAGATSVTIAIDAIDDAVLDGDQSVFVGASAAGYVGASSTLSVSDFETLLLQTDTDTMSEEGGGLTLSLVRSNTDIQSALVVQLASSDATEANVPTTVVIPAGQSSVTVQVTAADDSLLDGLQTVRIDAIATGYFGSTKSIFVADSERLTITVQATAISEKLGTTIATISRSNSDIAQALTVSISNSDESEAKVPATVVIPAGQSSVSFSVTAADDSLLDGGQTVTINAAATGYASAHAQLTVTDHETLTLTVSVTEPKEDDVSLTGIVVRSNSDLNQAQVVSLSSSDTTEIRLPQQVTIPAGQDSVSFAVEVIDDAILDGTQSVTLAAVAAGYASVPNSISVLDAETLAIVLDVVSLPENGGAVSAAITRSNRDDLAAPLVVTLSSSDTSEASVPVTVTIPANQAGVSFQLTLLDDTLLDGTQTILISASALGYSGASKSISVLDAEELIVQLSQLAMREAGSLITGTVFRSNVDTSSALLVTLISSDVSEATVPSSVIIPAGQSSAVFNISAVDDSLLDGTQHVVLAATATGYKTGQAELDVTDAESITLSIDAATVSEAGLPATAIVVRSNTDIDQPLLVLLSTSDASQLVAPASVIIPAGARSASFTVQAVDDSLLDGIQIITVEASAANYESSTAVLSIIDYEELSLTFNVNSISEKNGVAIGTVKRHNTDTQQPLTVQLVSTNGGQAVVPTTVVLQAGQASATFVITAVNDSAVDGTQTVLISASATGYATAELGIEVTDDDRLFPWNNPRNRLDVNDDGFVTPLDALLVINALNTRFQLPPTLPDPFDPVRYLDVDPNGMVTPLDALLVINQLNRRSAGEGESLSPAQQDYSDIVELLANDPRRRRRTGQ